MKKERALASWSSGKHAARPLHESHASPDREVAGLTALALLAISRAIMTVPLPILRTALASIQAPSTGGSTLLWAR